jgi:hypothetical protein
MNKEETRQRLIELGIAPEMVVGGVWDVRDANLSDANLTGADLSDVDLSDAVLTVANLTGADLRGADLRWADLRWANLSGADLSNADLTVANLSGAIGPFTTGFFGCDTAVAVGGYISIGTGRYTYEHWLEHYNVILRTGVYITYTPDEVADYGAWIKQAVARQRRIEGKK